MLWQFQELLCDVSDKCGQQVTNLMRTDVSFTSRAGVLSSLPHVHDISIFVREFTGTELNRMSRHVKAN
jgi:hypothetical protein